jgi:hypothetical protein
MTEADEDDGPCGKLCRLFMPLAITLTTTDIDEALPRIAVGLDKYLWLQEHRDCRDVRSDADYRRRFNGFYRIRRGKGWQDTFFALLEENKRQGVRFSEVLDSLHRTTGRCEASFASKMVATIDPHMPVIDSLVLRNLGLRLPSSKSTRRLAEVEALHRTLEARFSEFLTTSTGRYLVERFRETYPAATMTEIKMLDLVLWQTRPSTLARTELVA